MSPELGVKYPCYGEYKCFNCRKTWASSKSWRDYGQKCSKCSETITPHGLANLHYYECSNCDKTFKTRFYKKGAQCRSCNTIIMPKTRKEYMQTRIGRPSLFKDPNYDPKGRGNHREDLCEKCKILGRPCSNVYASKPTRLVYQNSEELTSSNWNPKPLQKTLNVPSTNSSPSTHSHQYATPPKRPPSLPSSSYNSSQYETQLSHPHVTKKKDCGCRCSIM